MDAGGGADAGREQRSYIESLSELFERIGGWSFDHRWVVLAICLLLLGACAYFASQARFDNSFEAYFDTDDPAYAAYNQFREDFGSDEISYILYEAPGLPHGPFDLGVMRKIASLTEALEEVPFVKEVTSLANVEYVEGVPDGLEIYELLEEFSGGQQELLEIREKVLAKPLYVGGLVSREGDYAAIIIDMDRSSVDPLEEIRLDPEAGDALDNLYPQVTYHAIEELLARPEYEGIVFHHVGDVPLNTVYNEISSSESGRLAAITFGVIALLLLAFFRRPIGIVGPLAVVALSVMVSIGLIGLLGWRLDLMFVMLPTLLIAVGVASSVHIIAEFRAYHAELGDRREAVRRTMYLVGTPCLLTSLTTAAGFVSMSIAPIKSIAHFAVYSAVGVVAAFLLSVTLLVVFLSFGRRRLPREASEAEKIRAKGGRLFHAALAGLARFDVRYRRAIIALFAGIFVLSALGIARLRVDSNFLNEFSEDEPIRIATDYVDEIMGGTYSFVYLFDSGAPEGIKSPEFLREIERLQAEADGHSHLVKKSYSIGRPAQGHQQVLQRGGSRPLRPARDPRARGPVPAALRDVGRRGPAGLRLERLRSREPRAALQGGGDQRARRDGRRPGRLPRGAPGQTPPRSASPGSVPYGSSSRCTSRRARSAASCSPSARSRPSCASCSSR